MSGTPAPRRILVTGGLGFIGSHLVQALVRQGHAVTVLDDASRGHLENADEVRGAVTLIDGSVCDRDAVDAACRGQELVAHLAAVQGTGTFYREPWRVLEVNVTGTLNVLRACGAHGVRRVFFSSSSEVYGTPSAFPVPEAAPLSVPDPLNPRYSYGGSKIAGELLTIHAAARQGFAYTIVRYHNVYGPRMGWDHVIPQFISRLERGEPFTVQGDGEQTRAFCYIEDAVDGSLRALFDPRGANEIFNIGNPEREWTINELIALLAEISGKTIRPIYTPFPGEGTRRRLPDIAKAGSRLGFVPRVTLAEGLRETHAWYRQALRAQEVPT
jgi:nucleoside-diphosphate-sugar epimerase